MVLTVLPEQEVVDPRHILTKKPNGHGEERRDKNSSTLGLLKAYKQAANRWRKATREAQWNYWKKQISRRQPRKHSQSNEDARQAKGTRRTSDHKRNKNIPGKV